MDSYTILSLPKNATVKDLKDRRRELVLECHPDKCMDKVAAHEKFVAINSAYEKLLPRLETKEAARKSKARQHSTQKPQAQRNSPQKPADPSHPGGQPFDKQEKSEPTPDSQDHGAPHQTSTPCDCRYTRPHVFAHYYSCKCHNPSQSKPWRPPVYPKQGALDHELHRNVIQEFYNERLPQIQSAFRDLDRAYHRLIALMRLLTSTIQASDAARSYLEQLRDCADRLRYEIVIILFQMHVLHQIGDGISINSFMRASCEVPGPWPTKIHKDHLRVVDDLQRQWREDWSVRSRGPGEDHDSRG